MILISRAKQVIALEPNGHFLYPCWSEVTFLIHCPSVNVSAYLPGYSFFCLESAQLLLQIQESPRYKQLWVTIQPLLGFSFIIIKALLYGNTLDALFSYSRVKKIILERLLHKTDIKLLIWTVTFYLISEFGFFKGKMNHSLSIVRWSNMVGRVINSNKAKKA